MRKPILFMTLAWAACDGAPPAGYTVVQAFAERAVPVRCDPLTLEPEPASTELRSTSDSTWTVLDAGRREVLEFDDSFRLLARTSIPAVGPGSAESPVSAAAVGDSAWAIADRGGLRLVLLSRAGAELASAPLDFMPNSLEASGDGVLITALPFGSRPPTLLSRYRAGRVDPLPVPRRKYDDMVIGALGNAALVETLPGGAALVIHQFLEPRAFRVEPDGTVRALRPPIPDGTARHAGFIPTAPLTDEQMPLTLLPAMAVSVDAGRSEVYLLTRSGGESDGRPERAVLRLTERLEFISGFTIDVRASGMAYLPRRALAVVVDVDDRFHACSLPRS